MKVEVYKKKVELTFAEIVVTAKVITNTPRTGEKVRIDCDTQYNPLIAKGTETQLFSKEEAEKILKDLGFVKQ